MKTTTRKMVGTAVVLVLVAMGYALLHAQSQSVVPQFGCGNEGEAPCPISTTNAVCDTGLALSPPKKCGCLLNGPFGGCLIPKLCITCENFSRRRPSISLSVLANRWTDWALRNQRELAQDEPLNWVMHLGTHNSFNTASDGHNQLPNQFYSITDQLRSGARVLTLDLYNLEGNARLCHSFTPGVAQVNCALFGNLLIYSYPPGWRYYSNAIKEIRNWLDANPNEILFIDLENWLVDTGGTSGDILGPIAVYLGARVLRSPFQAPTGQTTVRWPTRREMLATGKRVIIFDNDEDDLPTGSTFFEQKSFGSFGDEWKAKNLSRYPNCKTQHVLNDDIDANDEDYPSIKTNIKGTLTVEERETGFLLFGQLDHADIADAAECNYTFIVLDKFSLLLPQPTGMIDLPDFSRQAAAIWSWKFNDLGQNGACAMLEGSSGRWASANCGAARRFACAQPRSEAGLDPLALQDRLGEDWRITAGSGPWTDGQATCAAEFPGFNFSVPVNGYQNRKLVDANTSSSNLWLNYSQRAKLGKWAIGRLPTVAAPPTAEAGEDQVIECGNTVTLDGSASSDPQGDPLTYSWSGPFGTLSGSVVTATLPPGEHAISLTVSDGKGGTDTDEVMVTVNDTTPPTMTLALSPTVLGPPNHKPAPVIAEIAVHDTCDAEPPSVELLSVVSNEGANGRGDGNTSTDIANADIGTDDRDFELRAERSGGASERTYTARYRATDLAGNHTEASAKVIVPHDRGRKQ